MEIKDLIVPSPVVVNFHAEDKDALLHELARQAGHALKLAPEATAMTGITIALVIVNTSRQSRTE
jgi:hypothetical protein